MDSLKWYTMRVVIWLVCFFLTYCGYSRFDVESRDSSSDDQDSADIAEHLTQKSSDEQIKPEAFGTARISADVLVVDDHLTTRSPDGQIKSETLEPARIPVDVLVVTDVSPSMPDDHTYMVPLILPIAQKFIQYDWQMAVTSSIGSDCLYALIKKTTPLVDMALVSDIFEKMTYAELERNDRKKAMYEEVMKMATRAIKNELPLRTPSSRCRGKAKTWLRDDSMLVVVIITDEDVDDLSHPAGKQCPNSSCIDEFWLQLQKIRKPHITSRMYGFLNHGQNRDGADSPGDTADTNIGFVEWRSNGGEQLFDAYRSLFGENNRVGANDVYIMANNFKKWLEKYYIIKGNSDDISIIKLTYTDGRVKILTNSDYHVDDNVLILNDAIANGVKSVEITY